MTLQGRATHQLEPGALGVVEEGVEAVTVGRAYTGMATGSSLPAVPLWFGSMTSGAPLLQTRVEKKSTNSISVFVTFITMPHLVQQKLA